MENLKLSSELFKFSSGKSKLPTPKLPIVSDNIIPTKKTENCPTEIIGLDKVPPTLK